MENNIINREETLYNSLSKEHYFLSLLQILISNEWLSKADMERVQLQIVDLLREMVGYYTRDESSSVRVEVAEQIMLSIYYTIGIFLKSTTSIKESIDLIRRKDIKELFSKGEELLKEKVDRCKRLLVEVQKSKLATSNIAYIDTIDYGIQPFFKEYDTRFASHESPGSIDYPLAIDEMKLVGVEYLESYLSTLMLENRFCSYFDVSEIEALLKSFNKNSYHMLINIYQFVLTNYLGVILVGKRGRSLNITREDREYIKNVIEHISDVNMNKLFLVLSERLISELCIDDENLMNYINSTVLKLIPEIKNGINTNTLDKIFITINTLEENVVKYEDGESLENSIFKNITEEIRVCSKVDDKIKIIKNELHSLNDLVDVLSADCIFDDEFIYVFKALENFEIALLMKYLPNDEAYESDYGTESEREWHEKLKLYLDSIEYMKKEEILRIAMGIEI